jgi:hypothetical protein
VWEVEGTGEFVAWFEALDREDKVRVEATVEHLERLGPGLGRPWWYEEMIPVAQDLYRSHLDELREEGLIR